MSAFSIPARFDDRYDPEPDYEREDAISDTREEEEIERARERYRRRHPIAVLEDWVPGP